MLLIAVIDSNISFKYTNAVQQADLSNLVQWQVPCPLQGGWNRGDLRSLPPQTILQFYDFEFRKAPVPFFSGGVFFFFLGTWTDSLLHQLDIHQ